MSTVRGSPTVKMSMSTVLGLGCLLVLGFSITGATGKLLSCGVPPVSYDVLTKMCCNGKVENKLNAEGLTQGCCQIGEHEYKLYPMDIKICCGGSTFPKYDEFGRRRDCCEHPQWPLDGNFYYKEQQLCCHGTMYNRIDDSSDIGCCGKKTFNTTSDICCSTHDSEKTQTEKRVGIMQQCCGGSVYNRGESECLYDPSKSMVTLEPWLQICHGNEDKAFDRRVDNCVNGEVVKRHWRRCNGMFIDPKVRRCCTADPDNNSAEFDVPKDNRCCGNGSIKPSELKTCCHGVVHTKREGHGCCGRVLLENNRGNICCDNEVLDSQTSDCCDKKKFQKNMDLSCCATSLINTTEELCCNETSSMVTPINKGKQNDTRCCSHGNTGIIPFCDTDEVCTSSGVGKKSDTVPSQIPVAVTKNTPKDSIAEHIAQYRSSRNITAARATIVVTTAAASGSDYPKQGTTKGSINANPAPVGPRLHCPLCGKRRNKNFSQHIKGKRYMFNLTITGVHMSRHGMNILATLATSVNNKRTSSISLRTKYTCSCFKTGKEYILFTNRKVQNKTILRVNSNDLIVRNSKRIWGRITDSCREYKIRNIRRASGRNYRKQKQFKNRLMRRLCQLDTS